MFTFSIPHRRRLTSCVSLAVASALCFALGWAYAYWVLVISGVCGFWLCFERQLVEIEGRWLTFTRTLFDKPVGRRTRIDTSTGTRLILSVLFPRRGLPRPLRRIAVLKEGKAVAWTKDLPPDIEEPLLLALETQTGLTISIVESKGEFRPRGL